ncbi:MAG: hypothetical protein JW934_18700 [Anaerolineae bacterium]|nr:hypothetical protein [Anaerolineae bacterium]
MDYYTHVINTTRDLALRAAAELALIRARLAYACEQDPIRARLASACAQDIRACEPKTSRKQPRR